MKRISLILVGKSEYDDEEFILQLLFWKVSQTNIYPLSLVKECDVMKVVHPRLEELLSALKDACDEFEVLKAKEEYRKAHAEELKNMLDNVGSRMHNEDMEGDIQRCWTAMRAVTSTRGESIVPVSEVTTELEKILLQTFGEIPEGYAVESKDNIICFGSIFDPSWLCMD